ncbi:AAA family ATPase [Maricurvus nonylphenolicus]|uniref:ExeA family protein n=1 Tax=Maricurvus nonylphenolicus TaxID=1008307 RepID=UPI0036F29625
MYKDFFGLGEKPFSLTPDTQFFVNKQSHRDALNTMLISLKHCEGFIKVVGEVGTGKTLLCRKLLSSLDKRFITSYIPNPYLTPDELKAFVAHEIRAEYTESMPAHQLMVSIYRRLLQLARHGRQVVLVIDEAQAMPRETIEALRLLTNLETEKRKLLQIVLLGQPELDTLLSRSDLRQLKQRIVFSEYLQPFTAKGVAHYIRHRLQAAEGNPETFSPLAMWMIAKASRGIPRLINVMSHKALLVAYGRGEKTVSTFHAAKAIADTEESSRLGKLLALRWHLMWPAVGGLSAMLMIALPHWWGGIV